MSMIVNNHGIAGMMFCTPLKCLLGEVEDTQMSSVLDIEDIKLFTSGVPNVQLYHARLYPYNLIGSYSCRCRSKIQAVRHVSTCYESVLTESYSSMCQCSLVG